MFGVTRPRASILGTECAGVVTAVGGEVEEFRPGALLQSLGGGPRILCGAAPERAEDLRLVAGLCEQGVFRPVIDRFYPLARIGEAHARVVSGRKVGSVAVAMSERV
jgi:NADPH:quinone reductase-like Zn-dependent oxidoreductase